MAKSTRLKYQQYISYLIEFFQPRLFLHDYKIHIKYVKHIGGPRRYDDGYRAEIDIDYVYFEATITLSDKLFGDYKKGDFRQVAKTILHELVHILIEPMYQTAWDARIKDLKVSGLSRRQISDINEQITERLTSIIMSEFQNQVVRT